MRKKKRKKHTKIITKIVLFSGILIGGGIGIVTIMNRNVPEKRLMEYMKYIESIPCTFIVFRCSILFYAAELQNCCTAQPLFPNPLPVRAPTTCFCRSAQGKPCRFFADKPIYPENYFREAEFQFSLTKTWAYPKEYQ